MGLVRSDQRCGSRKKWSLSRLPFGSLPDSSCGPMGTPPQQVRAKERATQGPSPGSTSPSALGRSLRIGRATLMYGARILAHKTAPLSVEG